SSGDVWVADTANNRVEEFSPEGSYITQVGSLSHPQGVAAASNGSVWVSDSRNSRVVELSSSGALTLTFGWGVANGHAEAQTCSSGCRTGVAGSGYGQLGEPAGIAADAKGNLWVVDGANQRVEEFSSTGEYITQFGTGGADAGQFSN